MYILLEYEKGGNLFDFVQRHQRLGEDSARFYMKQLIVGLSYMHEKGFTHRDLKPENMLLDDKDNLKIADLGFACSNQT